GPAGRDKDADAVVAAVPLVEMALEQVELLARRGRGQRLDLALYLGRDGGAQIRQATQQAHVPEIDRDPGAQPGVEISLDSGVLSLGGTGHVDVVVLDRGDAGADRFD